MSRILNDIDDKQIDRIGFVIVNSHFDDPEEIEELDKMYITYSVFALFNNLFQITQYLNKKNYLPRR